MTSDAKYRHAIRDVAFAFFLFCILSVLIEFPLIYFNIHSSISDMLCQSTVINFIILIIFQSKYRVDFKAKLSYIEFSKYALIIFISIILINLPAIYNQAFSNNVIIKSYMTSSNLNQLIFLINFIVFAPIVEEALYRGIFYPVLKHKIDIYLAALISSILFALMHGYVTFTFLLILSLMYTYIYEKTKSLYMSMFAHILNNVIWIISGVNS